MDLEKGVWTCHAGCGTGNALQFAERLGLPRSTGFSDTASARSIIATYDYRGERGELLFQVVRFDPKGFAQRRSDGSGGWTWNLEGVRRVPYRLGKTLAAVSRGERVFIVEGEKDAERLLDCGVTATTNPGGAGKWRDEYAPFFVGGHVVILTDNDSAGEAHAQQVARSLHAKAAEVKSRLAPWPPSERRRVRLVGSRAYA